MSEPVKRYSGVLKAADSLAGTITLQVGKKMFAAGNVVTGGVYAVLRDRDIQVLETCIGALESLRIADGRAQGGMRARLDNYEASDWRQKEEIAEQAKTIKTLERKFAEAKSSAFAAVFNMEQQATTITRQRASIDLLDTLPDAHKVAEQAKMIEHLRARIEVATDDSYKQFEQALRAKKETDEMTVRCAEQAKTIERLEHERWMLAANIHARREGTWDAQETWDEMEQAEKIADAALQEDE